MVLCSLQRKLEQYAFTHTKSKEGGKGGKRGWKWLEMKSGKIDHRHFLKQRTKTGLLSHNNVSAACAVVTWTAVICEGIYLGLIFEQSWPMIFSILKNWNKIWVWNPSRDTAHCINIFFPIISLKIRETSSCLFYSPRQQLLEPKSARKWNIYIYIYIYSYKYIYARFLWQKGQYLVGIWFIWIKFLLLLVF